MFFQSRLQQLLQVTTSLLQSLQLCAVSICISDDWLWSAACCLPTSLEFNDCVWLRLVYGLRKAPPGVATVYQMAGLKRKANRHAQDITAIRFPLLLPHCVIHPPATKGTRYYNTRSTWKNNRRQSLLAVMLIFHKLGLWGKRRNSVYQLAMLRRQPTTGVVTFSRWSCHPFGAQNDESVGVRHAPCDLLSAPKMQCKAKAVSPSGGSSHLERIGCDKSPYRQATAVDTIFCW